MHMHTVFKKLKENQPHSQLIIQTHRQSQWTGNGPLEIQNSLCFRTWELKYLPNAVNLWSNITAMELPSPHIQSLLEPVLR